MSNYRGNLEVEHVDGIPWHEAPVPRRFHFCKPQTTGWIDFFARVDRCACGAYRKDMSMWISKNERRKDGER